MHQNNDMEWWLSAEAIMSSASFGNKPTVMWFIRKEKNPTSSQRKRGALSSLQDVFSVSLMTTLPPLGWNVITLIESINQGNILLNKELNKENCMFIYEGKVAIDSQMLLLLETGSLWNKPTWQAGADFNYSSFRKRLRRQISLHQFICGWLSTAGDSWTPQTGGGTQWWQQ